MQSGEGYFEAQHEDSEDVLLIANAMQENPEINPIERGVSALLAFHNRESAPVVEEVELFEDTGRLNIFSKLTLPDNIRNLIGPADIDRFSAPLIMKPFIKDKLELLERVLGRSGSQANTITGEVIKDMLIATDYPPIVEGLLSDKEKVVAAARELADYVASLQTPPT